MKRTKNLIEGALVFVAFSFPIYATSPFDACNPHAVSTSATAQLNDLSPVIMAVPVQEDQRELLWSDSKIDLNELKRLGSLSEKEILRSMKDDYQLQIGISPTTKEGLQELKSKLKVTAASSIPQDLLDPSQAKRNQNFDELENTDPIILKFTQAFGSQDGYGVFIRKGTDPLNAGVKASGHTIIFKDIASKSVMLHEFAHFMIHRDREKRGLPDPWAGPSDEEIRARRELESFEGRPASDQSYQRAFFTASRLQYDRQIQTMGEELDVHRLTIEHRNELNIADDVRGLSSAMVVFQQSLENLKQSTAAMRSQLEGFRTKGIKAVQEASDLEKLIQSSEKKIQASEQWFERASRDMGYKFAPLNMASAVSRQ